MEDENKAELTFYQQLEGLIGEAWQFIDTLMAPGWRLYQVLIILSLIAISYVLHHLSGRWVQAWVRTRQGWPKWQLRIIVQIRRRFGLIWFSVIAWVLWNVMQNVTWPSRSYLIGLAATLATALLLIAFVSRLLRNRPLRIIVRWGLWTFATLYYLNAHKVVGAFLDSIAFEFGDMRISILTAIMALVVITVLYTFARLASREMASTIRSNDDI